MPAEAKAADNTAVVINIDRIVHFLACCPTRGRAAAPFEPLRSADAAAPGTVYTLRTHADETVLEIDGAPFASGPAERVLASLAFHVNQSALRSVRDALALTFPADSGGPRARCAPDEALPAAMGDAGQVRQVLVNLLLNAQQASGGTGDALAGVIASLIGQGVSGREAAICGVYLHGLAGDIVAQNGMTGLTAGDVAAALPAALHGVQEG